VEASDFRRSILAQSLTNQSAMKYSGIFLLLLIATRSLAQPEMSDALVYDNKVYQPEIYSVQAYPSGNPLGVPFIQLNSGEVLEFHFDRMGMDMPDYTFQAIHCDHNWQPTALEPFEYIQGFPEGQISDVEASFNTLIDFIHYTFQFPNAMMKPRFSGNYLIVVYGEGDPDDIVLSLRVVVYETIVNAGGVIRNSSVIRDRYTHQEFDFTIGTATYNIRDVNRDLNVVLMQNWDWRHTITGLKPIFIKENELTFDYSGENTFAGGKEWRDFEMKDFRYASLEVANIMREPDGWHVHLVPDIPLGTKSYDTRIDLNGRYFVRNDEGAEATLDADYAYVHFELKCNEIPEGQVFAEGDFSKYTPEKYELTWNPATRSYTGIFLLKQGLYNYRYVVRDKYMNKDDISYTEGNHVETENDYTLIVYETDRANGYDRIIGQFYINSNRQ
ncbi:MAG: hypothetical protein RL220_1923, partial [Bacteroidota bacterium]